MANAGDEAQVKKAGEREKREQELEYLDLVRVMKTDYGRRVVNRLVEFCGPLREPFNTNGSITNYNLGRAGVGRKLFMDLDAACPELYLLMRQESRTREV